MDFLPKDISAYAEVHSDNEPELLKQLNRETYANVLKPRMLSGHYQGRLLSMWAKIMQPNLIVEIGTYTGYSALCMAEGLTKTGQLITIEVNEELREIAKKYFDKSNQAKQIIQITGDAAKLIEDLPNNIDLVFIDADKKNYEKYYNLIFEKVRKGGIIIADNVLWSGKVTGHGKIDLDTQTLIDFNNMVNNDPRVENLLLPIRDGLMIARKL
jgi:caffeoyl-CoA O-methyltransferase